jgi:hypothetical protein
MAYKSPPLKMTKRIILMLLLGFSYLCITSCSKENDEDIQVTITPSNITMNYEGTKQLSAVNATSWSTEDDFVAEVDGKGLVTGGHVGKTKIIASNGRNSAFCEVTVIPKYNLYDTPIIEWGASMTTITNKETHEKGSTSNPKTLDYNYSKNSNEPCLVVYNFEDGKLSNVMVVLKYLSYADAGLYLLERYQPVYAEKTNYTAIFADAYTKDKWKTVVGIQTKTLSGTKLTLIMYLPASKLPSMQAKSRCDSSAKMEVIDNDIKSVIAKNINMFH